MKTQLLPGMQLFPALQIGLFNGGLLLIIFYLVELLLVLSFPKGQRGRLFEYDRSKWRKRHRAYLIIAKTFSLVLIILLFLTPLSLGTPAFYLGLTLYLLGLIGFAIAVINFRNTPLDQHVNKGFYRISRNPQALTMLITILGIALAVGSWTFVLICLLSVIFGRARLIEEEKACLERYGDAYREYLENTPRYLLIKTKLRD